MTEGALKTPTAGILIIGNEILSGQVQDINVTFLTQQLRALGIAVAEVRMVRDDEEAIISALNALRQTYTSVFVTGGIGPTHDDITSASIAKAFGVKCERHLEIQRLFIQRYPDIEVDSDPRLRMADLPEGCTLLPCPLSIAPGFQMENVFVLAGVPSIMQSMFQTLAPTLTPGPPFYERGIFCRVAESKLAHPLEEIQKQFEEVEIGSYPVWKEDHFPGVTVMFKGNNLAQIEAALDCFRHHQHLEGVAMKDRATVTN